MKGKTAFYYLATKEIESQCMKRFADVIARATGDATIDSIFNNSFRSGSYRKAGSDYRKKPEKSRKGLYFISDNLIRFWFRYVYPFKGELELENTQIVLDEIDKDSYLPSTILYFLWASVAFIKA